MRRRHFQHFIVKTCAVLGYGALLFEWTIAAMPYLSRFLRSDTYKSMSPQHAEPSPVTSETIHSLLPSWAIAGLIGLVMAIVAAIVILSFMRAPKTIGKTGQRITQVTARTIVPVITKHHALPLQKRKLLTARIIFYLKLCALILPVGATLFYPVLMLPTSISHEAIVTIVSVIGAWALLLFSAEALLAKLFGIKPDQIW